MVIIIILKCLLGLFIGFVEAPLGRVKRGMQCCGSGTGTVGTVTFSHIHSIKLCFFLSTKLLLFTSKRKDFVQKILFVENYRTLYDLNTKPEP